MIEARLAAIVAEARQGEIEVTTHRAQDARPDRPRTADVLTVLRSGAIEQIEDYPGDPRGASCLLLGSVAGRAIHMLVTYPPDVVLITAYYPDTRRHEWTPDFRRRVRQ